MKVNSIYHENCIETLHRMPDEFVDMTITSPPYDDLRDYNGYHFPVEEIAERLLKKTADGGVVIWVVGDRTLNGDETLTSFNHALTFQRAGFKVHDTMIYAKNNPIPSDCGKRYRQCFEYMFCFSKGQPKTFNPLMRKTSTPSKFSGSNHACLPELPPTLFSCSPTPCILLWRGEDIPFCFRDLEEIRESRAMCLTRCFQEILCVPY